MGWKSPVNEKINMVEEDSMDGIDKILKEAEENGLGDEVKQ